MKVVATVILAVVLAAAGWFGWSAYQGAQESKFAAQAVQSSAAQTERQLKARKEDGITFAEYFKRGTATIDSLDKSISEMDSRLWSHKASDRDVALAFIEQCKAIIRADQTQTRLLMDESTARKATDLAKKEMDEADSSASVKWTIKRYQSASAEFIEVLNKQIESLKESKSKIEKMLAVDESAKSTFGPSSGLSAEMVASMKKSISPPVLEKPTSTP